MVLKKKSIDERMQKNVKKRLSSAHKYVISFIAILLFVIGSGLYFRYLLSGLPSLKDLQTFEPYLTSQIISADGVVITELAKQKRVLIPLSRIPHNMINATIATEDHRFFQHWGVDSYRFFSAVIQVVKSLRYAEGFSTITMQIARGLYLSPRKEIARKLREIITAVQIEKQYSKNEILEMYLNNSYFGHGAYGVHQAADIFFDTVVENLTLVQSAQLIAQINAPTRYSPILHPERSRNRRNLVLYNMLRHGYIDRIQYDNGRQEPLLTVAKLRAIEPESYGIAPYFSELARQNLEEMQKTYNFDMYRDGLKVYTTIDTRTQAIAEKAIAEQLELQQRIADSRMRNPKARTELLKKLSYTNEIDLVKIPELIRDEAYMDSVSRKENIIQAAFVAMDLENGHVIAMVGGRNFAESKFNRATQALRQPGSVFKPIVYAVAVDNGYPVTHQLLNQPITVMMDDGTRWSPSNYDNSIGGLTTLREGIRRSLNLISVRLIQQIIPPREVVLVAKKMGLTSYIDEVDAIALGVSEVYPIEIVSAYSAFPNKGIKVDPVYIQRIEDRFGSEIYSNTQPVKQEVLSEETAYIVTDLMRSVVRSGTGRNSHTVYGFNHPAGGKTGTTNDHTDAWFVGYSKQIIAGTWVGLDNPAFTLGNSQSGAVAALPIWSKFMAAAHDTLNLPVVDFEMPPGVIRLKICDETKDLASRYCPVKVQEIFNTQHQPTSECKTHSYVQNRRGK